MAISEVASRPLATVATQDQIPLGERIALALSFGADRCPRCGGWVDATPAAYVTTHDACKAVLDAISGMEWNGWTGRAQKLARSALGQIYSQEWVAEYERQAAARGAAVDGAYCCCGGAS